MTKRLNYGRYIILFIFILLASFIMSGCETSTELSCASISEITAVGSENYGVKVNFYNDSRLKDKYVDVQIKFDKICDITFWEENQEKVIFEIDDYDEWYSLTNLIAISKNKEGKETFEKFSEATGRTYLFNYDGEIEITFRVVVGDIEENSQGSGQILVGSEPISKQFTLKIK